MPPRLSIAYAAHFYQAIASPQGPYHTTLASSFARLSMQTRNAHILASLSDNREAYQKRIRKGRGQSAGKGKTAGRGHKGQKQHGKVKPWFQGGQTPLIISKGRKGFENHNAPEMAIINLDRIQAWIDAGRLDSSKPITPKELILSGCTGRKPKDGIKLCLRSLSAGNAHPLKVPIDIMVSRASASAIAAIEELGGRIVTRYYTRAAIRRLATGTSVNSTVPLPVGKGHVERILANAHKSEHKYRLPDPTSRWDIEYYRDSAHRGYLSHMLQPGESPSLYFKVPAQKKVVYISKSKVNSELEDTKLF